MTCRAGGQRLGGGRGADAAPSPLGLRGGVPAAGRARLRPLAGAALDPDDLDEDTGLANVILTNGARLYVDHAHPEYSTPEVTNPLDVVRWDKAGERVMAEAARRAAPHPGQPAIQLYKNNTDGKGATYGAHENYLMDRRTPFVEISARLIPFFVTRQVFTGAGRVGLGPEGRTAGLPAVASGPTSSRWRSAWRRR